MVGCVVNDADRGVVVSDVGDVGYDVCFDVTCDGGVGDCGVGVEYVGVAGVGGVVTVGVGVGVVIGVSGDDRGSCCVVIVFGGIDVDNGVGVGCGNDVGDVYCVDFVGIGTAVAVDDDAGDGEVAAASASCIGTGGGDIVVNCGVVNVVAFIDVDDDDGCVVVVDIVCWCCCCC